MELAHLVEVVEIISLEKILNKHTNLLKKLIDTIALDQVTDYSFKKIEPYRIFFSSEGHILSGYCHPSQNPYRPDMRMCTKRNA